jgi:hypothetical protein
MTFGTIRLKRWGAVCAIVLCAGLPLGAATTGFTIDTPTTEVLDYGSYHLGFRLFSNGGILTRMNFGVFKIVNLGVGWETDNVIGTQNIVVASPALYLKVKPFNGGMILPALAFGYDGQGYFWNKDARQFAQKEKGVFLVFGREYFIPGLELSFGANMNDFTTNKVYGFTSASLNIEDDFYFLTEYDNINNFPDARLNVGVRFFITPGVGIDLAARDIIGKDRTVERIIAINYIGKF